MTKKLCSQSLVWVCILVVQLSTLSGCCDNSKPFRLNEQIEPGSWWSDFSTLSSLPANSDGGALLHERNVSIMFNMLQVDSRAYNKTLSGTEVVIIAGNCQPPQGNSIDRYQVDVRGALHLDPETSADVYAFSRDQWIGSYHARGEPVGPISKDFTISGLVKSGPQDRLAVDNQPAAPLAVLLVISVFHHLPSDIAIANIDAVDIVANPQPAVPANSVP